MKRAMLGAVVGVGLSVAFKAAQARDLLPAGPQVRRAVLRRVPRPKADLESLTKEQLYERAQAEDVPGRSEMTKAELIDALRSKRRRA
jgi:DNA end-binding protein Ku